MSLEFLTPGDRVAESPLAQAARRDGATLKVRDGWLVPVRFDTSERDARALAETVAWADMSPLSKFEVRGETALDAARREDGRWWCRLTADLSLVLGRPGHVLSSAARAIDVTTQYGALLITGPRSGEAIARFCALDLRHAAAGAFLPGSIARTPGYILCETSERYLLLFGAAVSEYIWLVVSDAGRSLGGRPVGWDTAVAPAKCANTEAAARA